jgi:hypothetical protein
MANFSQQIVFYPNVQLLWNPKTSFNTLKFYNLMKNLITKCHSFNKLED